MKLEVGDKIKIYDERTESAIPEVKGVIVRIEYNEACEETICLLSTGYELWIRGNKLD